MLTASSVGYLYLPLHFEIHISGGDSLEAATTEWLRSRGEGDQLGMLRRDYFICSSEELALALANRSACLQKAAHYPEVKHIGIKYWLDEEYPYVQALTDIGLALAYGYPDQKRPKLLERRLECLMATAKEAAMRSGPETASAIAQALDDTAAAMTAAEIGGANGGQLKANLAEALKDIKAKEEEEKRVSGDRLGISVCEKYLPNFNECF